MNEAEVMFRDANDPVPFGKTFVQSDAFRTLFREGMGLVEETAAYLDGPGRDESRKLERQAALINPLLPDIERAGFPGY